MGALSGAGEARERSERIRSLNDAFRSTFTGGRVTLTTGVDALAADIKATVLQTVRAFKDFDEGNDPHGEHDFGAIEVGEVRCFFKIDYYDKDLELGSEDPSDPRRTTRILTVMLAEEY